MYFLARFVQKIFYICPFWLLKLIAGGLGIIFYLNGRRRRTAYRNLKIVFPQKNYRQITAILKKSYYNFSLSLIETLIASRIYPYMNLDDRYCSKEPGVCIGIHTGSWELTSFLFARKYKFAILAKHQKNKKLDSFLNQIRKDEGLEVCFGLYRLTKYIKSNYYTGLVVDHGAQEDAPIINFFGQLIPTPKGAVFLAKRFKKKIYPCFSRRLKGFRHQVEFLDSVDAASRDEKQLLSFLNRLYQKQLKKYPEGYLWWHKRFKYKKNREIVILSDARPGHLKQSQALLSVLESRNDYLIRSKIIEIKYRNYWLRVAANFIANFCPSFFPAAERLLKFVLDKNSYKELASSFADIVISTGNFTAPVSKMFSSSLGAKSAIILRTNLPPSRFDLAVIPEHDRVYADNAVTIKGALAYPLDSEKKKKKCKSFFPLGPDKKVALFIGGPVHDEKEFLRNMKFFIKQVKDFCRRQGYRILVSTSRRTPGAGEEFIKDELGDFANTEAVVIASEKNYDFVFEGFVLLSDIVFCSSESISMVSEVISLQRPCFCTFFETEDDKRKVFLNSIKSEIHFLRYPFKINAAELKISKIFYKNKKILEKAVGKLL